MRVQLAALLSDLLELSQGDKTSPWEQGRCVSPSPMELPASVPSPSQEVFKGKVNPVCHGTLVSQ